MVLDETPDRFAIRRHNELLVRVHDVVPLSTAQVVLQQQRRPGMHLVGHVCRQQRPAKEAHDGTRRHAGRSSSRHLLTSCVNLQQAYPEAQVCYVPRGVKFTPYLWQVQVDLITIKVCVEAGAVGVVHPDGALTLQHTSPAEQQHDREGSLAIRHQTTGWRPRV
jgi:hypothetical protein